MRIQFGTITYVSLLFLFCYYGNGNLRSMSFHHLVLGNSGIMKAATSLNCSYTLGISVLSSIVPTRYRDFLDSISSFGTRISSNDDFEVRFGQFH